MEVIEIKHNDKIYKIKRDIIIHVLLKITEKDYSNESNLIILKVMKKYRLMDEMTLESMQII